MYEDTVMVSMETPKADLDAVPLSHTSVDSQFLADAGCEPCSLLADPRSRNPRKIRRDRTIERTMQHPS